MANINELIEGWSFGKQAGRYAACGGYYYAADRRQDVAAYEPQYKAVGEGSGERR